MIQSQYDDRLSCQFSNSPVESPEILPSAQRSPLPSNVKGKDLFDSVLWKDPLSTSVFYQFSASLRRKIREDIKQTTPTHRFIRTLRDSRKLVRCYTQNIDGLESREGLSTDLSRGKGNRARFTKKAMEKPIAHINSLPNGNQDGGCEVVQLHGDLEVLRCNVCQKTCGWEGKEMEALLLDGQAPDCLSCAISDQQRRDRGKRGTKVGTLRPNIVLYGEEHPSADMLGNITAHDLGLAPDVLLILGTSLQVHGLKILIKEFAKSVRARPGGRGKVIFVNLSKPSASVWKDIIDYWICMDCDEWIGTLRKYRPDLWHIQKELKLQETKQNARKLHRSIVDKQRTINMEDEKENIDLTAQRYSTSNTAQGLKQAERGRPLRNAKAEVSNTISTANHNNEPCCANSKRNISQQLPTPPSSGHRARFQAAQKRPLSPDDAPAIPMISLKRWKPSLDIWEDKEVVSESKYHVGSSDLNTASQVTKSPGLHAARNICRVKSSTERSGRLR